MMSSNRTRIAAVASLAMAAAATALAASPDMTFFVTSAGSGKGADFGGLAGADAHCQALAAAAGAGEHTWRAYLSTQGPGAVSARDRIGSGPWHNAKGVEIAKDLAELHGSNHIDKATALTEKGEVIHGYGDKPNRHDILTGSTPEGTAFTGSEDMTCGNWTKDGEGSAIVGHADRKGTNPDPVRNASWNSSHKTAGCSDALLAKTGSAGYLYCFAVR